MEKRLGQGLGHLNLIYSQQKWRIYILKLINYVTLCLSYIQEGSFKENRDSGEFSTYPSIPLLISKDTQLMGQKP